MTARSYLLWIVLLSFKSSLAQFNKGDRMVGASIASIIYNSANSDIKVTSVGETRARVRSYNIGLHPTLGWFINQKTAVGLSLNINPAGETTSYEENGTTFQKDKYNTFNIGAGGFARSYLGSAGAFLPFIQIGMNAGISHLKTEGFFYGGSGMTSYKDTYNGSSSGGFFFNSSFQAGLTKKLSEKTGLDIYLGYNFSYNRNTFTRTTLTDRLIDGSIDETRENETVTKYTNHGFIFGAGFQVFLARRNK
jgi:hypothetical protein